MHLTRMALNPRRQQARRLLSSPQALHAAVMSAFPPGLAEPTPEGARVLWRTDSSQDSLLLWVASPAKPDLTHLVEQAGWPTTSAWETRDYSPLLDRLGTGQRWAFRLTANPVHSVRVTEGADTQPIAHVTVAQHEGWLLGRAEGFGFTVPTVEGRLAVEVRGRRTHRFGRGGASVTIAQATYDGVLQVDDPLRLRAALTRGIGRAKAYGCGLMTLAPLPVSP